MTKKTFCLTSSLGLLDYLFTCKDKEIAKLEAIISQLNDKTFDFISTYRQRSKEFEADFIQMLCHKWDGFWRYLVQTESINEEEYISLILYYADIEDINKLALKKYLEEKNNFLFLIDDASKYTKVKNILDQFDVKFKALDIPKGENQLFEFIYENENYVLNPLMIKQIISYYDKDKLESLYSAHLTTIKASGCENLYNRIWGDIKAYISNIFLTIETNTQESKEEILLLLNYDELDFEIKEKIIIKEEVLFENLDDISDALWHLLFRYSKTKPQWENISRYFQFKKNTIDSDLLIYLNKKENSEVLGNLTIVESEIFDDNFIELLNTAITQCHKLSLESYKSLINSQKTPWDEIDVSMLSHDKINVLIEQRKLTCNSRNFENLKKLLKSLAISLIEQHYDDFSQTINEFGLDNDDLILLISSTKISNRQKKLLLDKLNVEIIKQNGMAEMITKLLLEINYRIDDTIVAELIRYNHTNNNIYQNIQLLIQNLPKKPHLIEEALEMLGKPYSNITIKNNNKSPKLNDNVIIRSFLQKLKSVDYIAYWETTKNEISITRKYKSS